MEPTDKDITAFIDAIGRGEDTALSELFSSTYEQLHRVAHGQRGRWDGQQTLSTTVLVHEAYLKLSRQNAPHWRDRGHFFRVAAQAMRHILVDYAKRAKRAKRGSDAEHVSLDDASPAEASRIEELLALDDALTRLEKENPRWAQVVECRFFAGLEIDETAEALGISPATVKRDWSRGQACLYEMMNDER